MFAAKYILYKPRMVECMLLNTFWINTSCWMGVNECVCVHLRTVYLCCAIPSTCTPWGVGDRFIAPASTSFLTIIAEWNHLTTQHIFLQFRWYGHDKSVPYAYGMFAVKYVLDYICSAECMLLTTFWINHVLRNVRCQIHFALNQQTYITAIKKRRPTVVNSLVFS